MSIFWHYIFQQKIINAIKQDIVISNRQYREVLKVINIWVFCCLTGNFYCMGTEQYYRDLKYLNETADLQKYVMQLHCSQIEWQLQSDTGNTGIAIRLQRHTWDCHFFKLFVTSLHFDSDMFQLVGKQRWRNSHETCYMKLCYMQGNWDNNCVMIIVVVYIVISGDGDTLFGLTNVKDLKFSLEVPFD